MGQQVFIGSKISFKSLRDYIFDHKVNQGDSIVIHPQNYENIVEEIKNSDEPLDIPINVFGVLIVKDTTNTVELGKVLIVKNEPLQ
jgi:sulfate adenylyltransferase subunit 1 (EFTu-like GTPase family)